jgi:hypothetical protein
MLNNCIGDATVSRNAGRARMARRSMFYGISQWLTHEKPVAR